MRRKMIEVLTLPRMHVIRSIDEKRCRENGFFRADSASCHGCDIGKPCHWLSCHEKFSDLAKKPLYTLHASLLYCIDFITEYAEDQLHNTHACTCENCDWLREAHRVANEYNDMKAQNKNMNKTQEYSASAF